jgi:mitotic spindle assembly checkpoint protein MAD1
LEKTQKLLSEMKKTGEQKQNLFHRMQKKLLLVSRERDSYRLQLDSYEKDLTVTLNPNNININQLQTQRERIEALEKIVDNYRELNSKLESDLQSSNPALYSGTYLRCISINKFVLITYQEVNFIVSVKI